ncbi:MAG TPA: TIM barrel protein [Cyclobacteriaceae bacterium]|nr:TIM barrel protein [Cyclobacteriaceae bacterium]
MDRREFLRESTLKGVGAMTLPFFTLPDFFKETPMGVVVHSYASRWHSTVESQKYAGFSNAIELLDHCHSIGAGGIQVMVRDWSADFAKKLRDRREKLGLYLEGSIAIPANVDDVSRFEREAVNAREAGATILRTVTSAGRRYEAYHSAGEVQEFKNKAMASLQLAEPTLRKYKVKLAIENHKDWRSTELVEALKQLNSEWIGVTLDFGNSISLIEDPMSVIETLAPYALSTHVKDMGVEEYGDGFLLSEVPLGKGTLDLPKAITLCKKHNPAINFSLEMITRDPLEIPCLKPEYWSVFDGISGSELAQTLRMVRENKYEQSLPKVSQLSAEDRLAAEEENVVACLTYARNILGLK